MAESRLPSARWLMTVELITTYCLVIIALAVCLILKIITAEVFLGSLAGLSGLATFIAQKYFDKDKETQPENQPDTKQ